MDVKVFPILKRAYPSTNKAKEALPHATVQKEDDVRRETVRRLIHQFETHPNRESLMTDLDKNQKFDLFSEKSKGKICSIGNMEYFEMCEIISEIQCQDFLLYRERGIVYCTCGKCLQLSPKNRRKNKDRYDVLSIPNYVIKKGPSHGARHGPTERQRIYHKTTIHSEKQTKRVTKTILDRLLNSPRYRDS